MCGCVNHVATHTPTHQKGMLVYPEWGKVGNHDRVLLLDVERRVECVHCAAPCLQLGA